MNKKKASAQDINLIHFDIIEDGDHVICAVSKKTNST